MIIVLLLVLLCCGAGYLIWQNNQRNGTQTLVMEYEQENYNAAGFRGTLFATNLCVTAEDVIPDPETYEQAEETAPEDESEAESEDELTEDSEEVSYGPVETDEITSAALFDLNSAKVEYAYNVHKKLYPASITKIMTALVAIENTDLDEVVTVQEDADVDNFAYDEVTIGLKTGDTLTMQDLLYGLLLCSGNDAAIAIADYVGGDSAHFVQMMNEEAGRLMATSTHFVNANGLQNEDHYTTVYDLYLIFNECIKHQDFVDILSAPSYHTEITDADGEKRECDWEPSNFYGAGLADAPEHVTVIGGKTGTTKLAGNCLILLDEDSSGNPYISIVMGADTRGELYTNMNALMNLIAE